MRTEKDRKRVRRQARKRKLHYLRKRLVEATTDTEKRRMMEKIRRISNTAPLP